MKKPKGKKIILLAAAVLTLVLLIMAVVMLNAVNGDALFYMDSARGHFYAVSYRWVCLGEGLLILFWIILGVSRGKAILAKLLKAEWKKKEAKAEEVAEPKETEDMSGVISESNTDAETKTASDHAVNAPELKR